MATIKSSLSLFDGITDPLQHIHKALNIVLNSFEAVQNASGNIKYCCVKHKDISRHAITGAKRQIVVT